MPEAEDIKVLASILGEDQLLTLIQVLKTVVKTGNGYGSVELEIRSARVVEIRGNFSVKPHLLKS